MFLKLTSILPRVDEWAYKMDRYEEMEREMNKLKPDNDNMKSENEKMAKVIEERTVKLEAKEN